MIPAKTKKSKKRRSRGYGNLVFFIREDVDEPIEAGIAETIRTSAGSPADETQSVLCFSQLTQVADLSSSSDFTFGPLTLDDSDAFSFFLCSTLHVTCPG